MAEACSEYVDKKKCVQAFGGKLTAKDHLEDLGVDGRIILKFIFELQNGGSWTGLIWLRM